MRNVQNAQLDVDGLISPPPHTHTHAQKKVITKRTIYVPIYPYVYLSICPAIIVWFNIFWAGKVVGTIGA